MTLAREWGARLGLPEILSDCVYQRPLTLLGASRCNQLILVKALLIRDCTRVARKAMRHPTQQCLTMWCVCVCPSSIPLLFHLV